MYRKYSCFIFFSLLLVYVLVGNVCAEQSPSNVSTFAIEKHVLCREVSDGEPGDITKTFTADDTVCSWLRTRDGVRGDEVEWLFEGPDGIESRASYTLELEGDQSCYTCFDLNDYENVEMEGDWKITVYLNGEEALTEYFTVEPLAGLLWWGPFVGLLIILLMGAVAAAVITLIVIIVIKVVRRRRG